MGVQLSGSLPYLDQMKTNGLSLGVIYSGRLVPGGPRALGELCGSFIRHGVNVIGINGGFDPLMKLTPDRFLQAHPYKTVRTRDCESALDHNNFIIRSGNTYPGRNIYGPADLVDTSKTAEFTNILNIFKELNIGAFVAIGGGNTLSALHILNQISRSSGASGCFNGATVLLPKSAEHDTFGIGDTVGFSTATQSTGAELMAKKEEAETKCQYLFVEVPGEISGWYAYQAAMFGRPSKVFLPEQFRGKEFNLDTVSSYMVRLIAKRAQAGKEYGVFCLASGIKSMLAEAVMEDLPFGDFDRVGISDILAAAVAKKYQEVKGRALNVEATKLTYPNTLAPNITDATLASELALSCLGLIGTSSFGQVGTVSASGKYGIPFEDLLEPSTLRDRPSYIPLDGPEFIRLHEMGLI